MSKETPKTKALFAEFVTICYPSGYPTDRSGESIALEFAQWALEHRPAELDVAHEELLESRYLKIAKGVYLTTEGVEAVNEDFLAEAIRDGKLKSALRVKPDRTLEQILVVADIKPENVRDIDVN